MHWNKQEQFIFDIVLFVLVVFQIFSLFMLLTQSNAAQDIVFLVGINALLFVTMIPYAKWVWKTPSYQQAFLQLARHEFFLLGLIIVGIIVAMLVTGRGVRT